MIGPSYATATTCETQDARWCPGILALEGVPVLSPIESPHGSRLTESHKPADPEHSQTLPTGHPHGDDATATEAERCLMTDQGSIGPASWPDGTSGRTGCWQQEVPPAVPGRGARRTTNFEVRDSRAGGGFCVDPARDFFFFFGGGDRVLIRLAIDFLGLFVVGVAGDSSTGLIGSGGSMLHRVHSFGA